MSAQYYLAPGEHEIINEKGLWNKAKLNAQPGQIILTDQRVLFVKDANPFANPLLRMLFKKQDTHLAHDIKVTDIKSFSNEKFGMNKRIISFELLSGEIVKFSTTSEYAVWEAKLKELKG